LPDLRELSNILPSYKEFIDTDKTIENDTTLTKEDKEARLEELKQYFFRLLGGWNLTMKGNKIETIKLSVMIDLIKRVIGEPAKINLLDYSCNSVSMFVPNNQLPNKQYMMESDIEQGYSKGWGGRRRSRRHHKKNKRTKITNKSKSKKQKRTKNTRGIKK
jgi:hypothetical protein